MQICLLGMEQDQTLRVRGIKFALCSIECDIDRVDTDILLGLPTREKPSAGKRFSGCSELNVMGYYPHQNFAQPRLKYNSILTQRTKNRFLENRTSTENPKKQPLISLLPIHLRNSFHSTRVIE